METTRSSERNPIRVILLSCGSYNPPTHMHLRMFERARDHLHNLGTHQVVGGVISPVNDAYAKKELASGSHRCEMLNLALKNSDWIRLSTWEIRQDSWTRTRACLQHHQSVLNSVVEGHNDSNRNSIGNEELDWIPESVRNNEMADQLPIHVKLLCGGDLLESFATPGLWADDDIAEIVGQYGLIVITREGSNPYKFIYDSDILSKHLHNIQIVTEWIPNEVSSTRIRRALKRGESVKYLLQDAVIDYVYTNGIYEANRPSAIKLELSSINSSIDYLDADEAKYQHNDAFLTPSPSDTNMQERTPCNMYRITDTVLQKNLQNNCSPTYSDDRSSQNSIVNMYSEREKLLWSMVFDSINFGGQSSSSLLQYSNSLFSRSDSPIELPSSARARNELLAFEDNAECELATLYDHVFINEDALSVAYEDRLEDDEYFVKDSADSRDSKNVEVDRSTLSIEMNDLEDEESDVETSGFETKLEIDGKYLKSLVNSRKYPRKVDDNESTKLGREESRLAAIGIKSKPKLENIKSVDEKAEENEPEKDGKLFDDISYVKRLRLIVNDKSGENNKNQRQQLQGSLDSINLKEAGTVANGVESMAKKSKSFESIKRNAHLPYEINEDFYCDPDSKINSERRPRADATDASLDRAADGDLCSEDDDDDDDDDSTECDICSSYNLQDSNDLLDCKDNAPAQGLSEPIEICEICGEPAAITDGSSIVVDQHHVPTIDSKPAPLSLPKAKSTIEISRGSYKTSTFDDEHFEIDNCGFQDFKLRSSLDICKKPEPLYVNLMPKYRQFVSEIDNRPSSKADRDQPQYCSYDSEFHRELERGRGRDEVEGLSRSFPSSHNKFINRTGSYVKKSVDEDTEEQRRFASVDNLQNRTFFKSADEKLSKSRDNEFATSADSVRHPRLARNKSLRRSADNVKRLDSSGDNLDVFEEAADTDDTHHLTAHGNSNCPGANGTRDSDTIKMILTKHGIKIISQKETIL